MALEKNLLESRYHGKVAVPSDDFIYGDLIIDKEDHQSDYHKEVYKQLKVFRYTLVPFVRIMKIEETFHNFRPRKLSITNEFHHLEDLNLELDLDEAFQEGVSVIEWPERLAKLIPKQNRIDIIINHINSSDCLRNIEIVSNLKIK